MREFEYFLFQNFDPDMQANHPGNPRTFFGQQADGILSWVAESHNEEGNSRQEDEELIPKLLSGGVLRKEGNALRLDCPVFLREDAPVLRREIPPCAAKLAHLLEKQIGEISACCADIQNGCAAEENLYHVLFGMVFDGRMFDALSARNALAVSRVHSSGLDYLAVIYEKCPELELLSDRLLCSYNRLAGQQCAMESFGDAQGKRRDFYRLFRLMEGGDVPQAFAALRDMMIDAFGWADKDALLAQVREFVLHGEGNAKTLRLLEAMGYAKEGRVCVPVYLPEHMQYVERIARLVEEILGDELAQTLLELAAGMDITAVRHGVNPLEIANELYHIVFGFINEELVRKNLVASPPFAAGEGRYRKCIEIF